MLDEVQFREGSLKEKKPGSPLKVLMGAVLAAGSLACGDPGHSGYYEDTMAHFPLTCLISDSAEVAQALAILGSFYLASIGAADMAKTHVEAALATANSIRIRVDDGDLISAIHESMSSLLPSLATSTQSQKRMLLSIKCLHAWSNITDWPAITSTEEVLLEQFSRYAALNNITDALLVQNVKLLQLASRVQSCLAPFPVDRGSSRDELDTELVEWRSELPINLKQPDRSSEAMGSYSACCVLKRRWQLLRLLLHRPMALDDAPSRSNWQASNPGDKEQSGIDAVSLCREPSVN